ncbi:protein KTI12-like [Tropilaelaps mercedesae]|uniref:Protein KTI12 homolog n=1 Tax=Tropilaelaps mercedesae TaxID=418985 RepID=A0A1V9XI32_9ACAR|nr:protein KTI12-like [Tropilaelaps mercedesae]
MVMRHQLIVFPFPTFKKEPLAMFQVEIRVTVSSIDYCGVVAGDLVMPLIVITGYPSCGKSTRARQLEKFFTAKYPEKKVKIVSADANIDRNSVFAEAHLEKEVRAKLMAEVQRELRRDNLVIIDAHNYIKGYRYELYCLSKSVKTTQCTLSLPINIDVAWTWNSSKPEQDRYSRETFDALILRYEDPDSKNRWDTPLIAVHEGEEIAFADVDAALFQRKAPPPNKATQPDPVLSTNFLYDLDRLTQETVESVLKNPDDLVSRRVTLPELSRLRRQFINYVRQNPIQDTNKIRPLFENYIRNTTI